MSLVYISSHNENVYDWAEKEREKIIRPEKYTSIHRKRIRSERIYDVQQGTESNIKILQTRSLLSSHKTLGYPEVPLESTCNFLRKNKGIKCYRISNTKRISQGLPRLPPVPKKNEQYIINHEKPKNFKILNIQKNRNTIPKRPQPKVVYSNDGSKYELCRSGVTPSYIYAPNFGKVPKYINKIKNCLKKCRDQKDEENKPNISLPSGIRFLSNEERQKIFRGIQKNWWETTLQFNTIPVIVDTIPMKLRKNAMELHLRQLEQDLLLVQNNPVIYICEDNNYL